jgi:hypothetical protein
MTIYVDVQMNNGWKMYGRTVQNCHLFTDGPVDELHAFAVRIGMKRTWFQDKSVQHYDLTPSRRRLAVAAGAVEVDRRQAVAIWKQCRENKGQRF